MEELYGQLYDMCSLDTNGDDRAVFVAMQGKHYREAPKKLMIVGRAPNGWYSLNAPSKQAFMIAADKQFSCVDRWKWIQTINGTQYLLDEAHIPNLKDRYCVSAKPFWSYSKEIWNHIAKQDETNDIWQENVVWSNLYKISPARADNPDYELAELQLETCRKILKRELDALEPDYVLLMTGYDWFAPFSELFENVVDLGKRNICRGKNKNAVFVEGTARYGKAHVVIACRPEHRNKFQYVQAVMDVFNPEQN